MTDRANEFDREGMFDHEVMLFDPDEVMFDPKGMSVCSYCLGVVPVIGSAIDRLTGQPALYYYADWWDAHNPGCPFNEPLPQECPF